MKYRFTALVILVTALISCSESEPPASSVVHVVPVLADAKPSAGQHLAEKVCERCHGRNGLNPLELRPYLAGQAGDYLFKALTEYQQGIRKHAAMQAVTDPLSKQDLKNLAAYYADLKGDWKGAGKGFSQQTANRAAGGSAARGKTMVTPCVDCHGVDGNSMQSGVPSLAGLEPEYVLDAFENYFAERRQGTIMKHFKHAVNKQELKDLGAYFASQTRKANRFPIPGNISKGKAMASVCAGCHGSSGHSIMAEIPTLAAQNAEYIVKALSAYRDGKRQQATMQAVVKTLDDNSIKDLASYYANLPPLQTKQPNSSPVNAEPMIIAANLATTCAGCHGDHGNSVTPGIPSINRQHPAYFMDALQSYADGRRNHSMMKSVAEQLSPSAREKLALLYAPQQPLASPHKVPEGASTASETMLGTCNGCHGDWGISTQEKIPTLAGQDAAYLVSALQAYASGKRTNGDMQNAVHELKPQDYLDLAAYYAKQTPTAQTVRPLDPPQTLAAKCDRCHGPDGHSEQHEIPRLAGQTEAYLIKALTDYRNEIRKTSIMYAMASVLSLTEIEGLAHYYASK